MAGRKSGNIGNQSVFKINTATNLEDLTNILMCFFLGKFIFGIHEYFQKSKKLN